MKNPFNCECGGLRHICARHGHLPGAIDHYRGAPEPTQIRVVWSGKDPLLDDRAERFDERIDSMPTYDLDDGEVVTDRPARKYTRTGKHIGKCSRTNPNAPQYIPRRQPAASEEQTHG